MKKKIFSLIKMLNKLDERIHVTVPSEKLSVYKSSKSSVGPSKKSTSWAIGEAKNKIEYR